MSGERTLSSAQASPEAKALVEALRDAPTNERSWAIAQDALDAAASRGASALLDEALNSGDGRYRP